ncbi:hypothetical protein QPK13_22925 [Photorhabdus tasmaniensis]
MIKFAGLILISMLAGCQSIGSKIADLPSVGFDPVMYSKSEAFTDGKVTFLIESSGTDVWLIAKNGTKDFIELSELNLAGSRCTYSARGKQLVSPGSVSTFIMPTIGLLGLCYSNEDQLTFINNAFMRISQKPHEKVSLPLLFSIKYDFPGAEKMEAIEYTQPLNLTFSSKEQS